MPTIAERFLERFHGLMRAHGTYTTGKQDARGKVQGKARTLKDKVTARKWDEHLAGETGLGVVPVDDEGLSRFGAIDVDVYDLDLEHLEKRIQEAELPLVVTRTKSGGAHLYLFIRGSAKASLVRDKLQEWSILLGYPSVEVFPKQSEIASEDDIGSWINMPYFAGKRTTRYAIRNGEAILDLEEFLKYAEEKAITEDELAKVSGKQDPILEDAPPCLQHLARSGFPEGTRNQALYNLGVFCKMKFGDEWQDHLREMNKKYLQPPLKDNEVTILLKQLGKKQYFYKCKEPPIVSACNRSICSRREYGIRRSTDDPGISLDGLVKVLTDPPMWFINVDGKRIKLDSSDDLLSQRRFERICVDAHNIVPNRIAENAWRDILRGLMDKVEEVQAPEDAGPMGQFMYLLEKFCEERNTADSPDEIILEKVYTKDGRMFFKSSHLLMYMDRYKFKVGPKQAWSFLRDIGATDHRFRVQGQQIRAWSIPEFKSVKLNFDKAKVVDDDGEDLF